VERQPSLVDHQIPRRLWCLPPRTSLNHSGILSKSWGKNWIARWCRHTY
jgi:hypothetical protein